VHDDGLAQPVGDPGELHVRQQPSGRVPPRDELVNALEFEDVAKLKLAPAVYSTIAGGDRAAFERITFRPRMMVPVLDMDLSVELFGDTHFTPIIVGPVAEQKRYHPDGELATVRGASAAQAGVIVTSRSSAPIPDIAAQAKTPLWYSMYAEGEANAPARARDAIAAGCKALCITIGASLNGGRVAADAHADWKSIDQIRRGLDVPVLIKGVMTPQDARSAVEHGVQGIVVSNHGGAAATPAAPIEVLPSIAEAVAGKVPVLVDGGFRRNSDIVKALAFGAAAVLVARPVMWALAAYGAEGVQTILELLQSDLARNMGALGAPTVAALTREMVKIHRR
jgi:4-hydroxymandelate oxidase